MPPRAGIAAAVKGRPILAAAALGDVPLAWPQEASFELKDAHDDYATSFWSGNRVGARRTGTFRLEAPSIAGFEPIAPREVVVEPGKWTRVEVRLQRKR